MDNSQLKRTILELENECSHLENEKVRVREQMAILEKALQEATVALTARRDTLVDVLGFSERVMTSSDEYLQNISDEQKEISLVYEGFKNIEIATQNIRELNDMIRADFSGAGMMRRVARKWIESRGANSIRPDMIAQSVGAEHLESPDYWLTAAILSIAHQSQNEFDEAEQMMQKALELDSHQATLFYLGVNLLQGRRDVAFTWFERYASDYKTGEDAEVLLFLLHAVNLRSRESDSLKESIQRYLVREFKYSSEQNDEQSGVMRVRNHLVACNSAEIFSYENLREYVDDYIDMSHMLTMAKDNEAIRDFMNEVGHPTDDQGSIFIERFLGHLVDTPYQKERQFARDIAYNEEVIRCLGDTVAADISYQEKYEQTTEPLNFMQECINWLFYPNGAGISDVARGNVFFLCRDLLQKAIESYSADYRKRFKYVHPATIRDYHTDINFGDKPAEMAKMKSYYEGKRSTQTPVLNRAWLVTCICLAVALLGGGVVSFVLVPGITGLSLAIVGAVLCACSVIAAIVPILVYRKKCKILGRIFTSDMDYCEQVIEKLFAEFEDFHRVYDEHDHLVYEMIQMAKR